MHNIYKRGKSMIQLYLTKRTQLQFCYKDRLISLPNIKFLDLTTKNDSLLRYLQVVGHFDELLLI